MHSNGARRGNIQALSARIWILKRSRWAPRITDYSSRPESVKTVVGRLLWEQEFQLGIRGERRRIAGNEDSYEVTEISLGPKSVKEGFE